MLYQAVLRSSRLGDLPFRFKYFLILSTRDHTDVRWGEV